MIVLAILFLGAAGLIVYALALMGVTVLAAIERRRKGLPPPAIPFSHILIVWCAAALVGVIVWLLMYFQVGGLALEIAAYFIYLSSFVWGPPLLLWASWRLFCRWRGAAAARKKHCYR